MASIADLYVTLQADSRKLVADAQKGGAAAGSAASKSFGARFKGAFSKGGMAGFVKGGFGLGAGLLGFNAATASVSAVVGVLGDAVRMAAEEEAAIAQLTRAIQENDAAWDGNIDSVEALITARQQLGFSDGEQRDSLRQLVAVTGDVSEALDLQRQAMDLARLKGLDLGTASTLLGKVFAGNLGTLSRYGIVLEEGATATEALAEIQRRAAGQADAWAETTSGKLTRAQLALDDAMEVLGATLLPVVAELAGLAADTIPDLVDAIGEALAPLADLAGALGDIGAQASALAETVDQAIGRDVVNDFANFTRILVTGGTVLATDSLPAVTGAAQDLGEALGFIDSVDPTITVDTEGVAAAQASVARLLGGLSALQGRAPISNILNDYGGGILPEPPPPAAGRGVGRASGGSTVNLSVHGLPMRAETPREVVEQLRRAARMGALEPPRRQWAWD